MKTPEELLTKVMNLLGEKYKEILILKGGMLLALYQSPRSTRDVDFVLLSKKSRKIWRDLFSQTLESEGIKVKKINLNSRGIFLDIEDEAKTQQAQIEVNIKTSTHLPPEPISTAPLAKKYSLSGRIISSMAIPEAFSHKIAATLERDVMRDLYDLSQLEALGSFDVETLKQRLSELAINRARPKSVSMKEAAQLLKEKLAVVEQKKIETELYPLLPLEFRPGVLGIIRATVSRIIQKMENLE